MKVKSTARFLVYDAQCATCSQLATTIHNLVAGKLEPISIYSPEAHALLDQVYPQGWSHQPYLVTVTDAKTSAITGLKMVLQLGTLLGVRKGWEVYTLARQHDVNLHTLSRQPVPSRRRFLKNSALFAGGAFLLRPQSDTTFLLQNGLFNAQIQMIQGAEIASTIENVRHNSQAHLLWTYLEHKGFVADVANVEGAKMATDNHEGFFVYVPFKSSSGQLAKLFYLESTNGVKTGVGIFGKGRPQTANIFEVRQGTVTHTETRTNNGDGTVSITSPQQSQVQIVPSQVVVDSSTECDVCKSIYYYVWNGGCTVGGAILCTAVCVGFTGPALFVCPVVCGLVYWGICELGYNEELACEPYCG